MKKIVAGLVAAILMITSLTIYGVTADEPVIDLGQSGGIIEAQDFISKSPGIELENNGTSIGYYSPGRYLVYRVKIPETARYTLVLSSATERTGNDAAYDIYIDEKLYYSTETPQPSTGGWSNFQDLEMDGKVSLPEGVHELKVVSRTDEINIDKFKFIKYDNNYQEPPEEMTASNNIGTGEILKKEAVHVITSSADNSGEYSWFDEEQTIENKNVVKDSLDIRRSDDSNLLTIDVDDTKEYQNILGMGVSVEDSTVNNLLKMSPQARRNVIKQLVDPVNGMGNTLFRITIATSDFAAAPFYTYYDGTGTELNGEPDWENVTGNGFSIQKDHDYGIIKVIKEIQDMAKELGVEEEIKFFASSWTPPGWMKLPTDESNSLSNNGLLLKAGKLNDDYIGDLAKYYVRYIEEYKKEGIPVYAMTLQNEPQFETDYPSCLVTGAQEAKLAKAINDQLTQSTVLTEVEKDIKLWAFDHNFDGAKDYVDEIMATKEGRENIDGIAFHPYGGEPKMMGELYEQYKGQYTMHLTERAVWGTSGANDILQWFRNGAESYNGWVTMLDSNIGTHQWPWGTPGPTLFIQDANNHDNYWATPEVYLIGQFSKYVRPGYVRIDTNNGKISSVTNVAFKDSDTGKIVMIVVNNSGKDQHFKVVAKGTQFNATLETGNVATYIWDPVVAPEIETPKPPVVEEESVVKPLQNTPKTGDTSMLEITLLAFVASTASVFVARSTKKRRNSN